MEIRLQNKILTSVQQDESSQCWLWRGQISNSGHGRLMVKYTDQQPRLDSARNVSYRAFVGDIPQGLLTRQTCNNRLCVNPEHLQLFNPEK